MKSIETIVVGTDFSSCAEAGLRAVEGLCRMWPVQSVHVVAVVPPVIAGAPLMPVDDISQAALKAAQARLERLALDLGEAIVVSETLLGAPAVELTEYADSVGADLLVAATHGRTGLPRAVLGSVTANMVRMSRIPVLVVPAHLETFGGRFEQVLAAVDLSPISSVVLRAADGWAERGGGRVRALSLFEAPVVANEVDELLPHYVSSEEVEQLTEARRDAVEQLVARAELRRPIEIDVLAKAPAGQAVVEVAQLLDVDLVVVGTSGHNAIHRLILGSTANRVLEGAGRPVLVVPREVHQGRPEAAARIKGLNQLQPVQA